MTLSWKFPASTVWSWWGVVGFGVGWPGWIGGHPSPGVSSVSFRSTLGADPLSGDHRAGSQPSERMRVKLKASTCHSVTAFTL